MALSASGSPNGLRRGYPTEQCFSSGTSKRRLYRSCSLLRGLPSPSSVFGSGDGQRLLRGGSISCARPTALGRSGSCGAHERGAGTWQGSASYCGFLVCGTSGACYVPESYQLPLLESIRFSSPMRECSSVIGGFSLDTRAAHKTVRVRERDILGVGMEILIASSSTRCALSRLLSAPAGFNVFQASL